MKKKKIYGGICAATLTAIMSLQCMTVLAVDAPSGMDELEESEEGWEALWGYMDEVCGDPNIIICDEKTSLSEAKKYFESGAYLVPYSKVADVEKADQDDGSWDSVKDAVKAVYENSETADGSYCISEDMTDQEVAMWDKIEEMQTKCDDGDILIVSQDETQPDVSEMDPGTYWCTESEWESFWAGVDNAEDNVKNYRNYSGEEWEWKEFEIYTYDGADDPERFMDVPKSAFQNYVSGLEEAYNNLVDILREGTKETASSESGSSRSKKLKRVSRSASDFSEKQEEESAPVLVNEVTYANGTKQQSSIEGIYSRTFAAGTIFNDDQSKIKQAAGLSEEEIKDGARVKYYICTSLNKDMNQMLSDTVGGQGYQVLGVMNCDLYKLYRGETTKIRTMKEALTVTIGVPDHLRSDKYEFVVFCYDESGHFVIMPDLDTDVNTITIQAGTFGYWAVGYKIK